LLRVSWKCRSKFHVIFRMTWEIELKKFKAVLFKKGFPGFYLSVCYRLGQWIFVSFLLASELLCFQCKCYEVARYCISFSSCGLPLFCRTRMTRRIFCSYATGHERSDNENREITVIITLDNVIVPLFFKVSWLQRWMISPRWPCSSVAAWAVYLFMYWAVPRKMQSLPTTKLLRSRNYTPGIETSRRGCLGSNLIRQSYWMLTNLGSPWILKFDIVLLHQIALN